MSQLANLYEEDKSKSSMGCYHYVARKQGEAQISMPSQK